MTTRRFSVLTIMLLAGRARAQGSSNVAITSTGIAVAAQGSSGGLITRFAAANEQQSHDLPPGVSSLDDVSIDAENESLVFALSTSTTTQVCSYVLEGDASLSPVNCAGSGFAVSPYSGLSAMGGTLIVSGGTGGFTVFEYDTNTGMLNSNPSIRNLDLGVIGYPDVTLVDPSTAALSTDFSNAPRFGTTIVSLEGNTAMELRDFRVEDSAGFTGALTPANFALVNAIYEASDGSVFMYTANGDMTVQDPYTDGGVSSFGDSAPSGFLAVTVAVNAEKQLAVFGGLVNEASQIVVFDITTPRSPTFVSATAVAERITSVASSGNVIVYVTQFGTEINILQLEGSPNGEPTMAPVTPSPTNGPTISPMSPPPMNMPTTVPEPTVTTAPINGPTVAPSDTSGALKFQILHAFWLGLAGLARLDL